jgi:hypothetical protein
MYMNFELRHFDTPLLRFSCTEETNAPQIKILWQNKDKSDFLPLDLTPTEDGISKWLRHRAVPSNRAYVHNLLSKCGLNANRPIDIIKISKGLSLNDCFLIVPEGFEGGFDEYNLYDNRFSRILAFVAFTGYGSSIRTSLVSSPEFTTNGMLPKCWRRENGKISLYKGGTFGASNTGNEPYSEFYAYQIAQMMGFDAVPYTLSKWKGELCSVCGIFTDKEKSFIPVGRIVKSGDFDEVRDYYRTLGPDFLNALDDMIVFDALICNTDRHYGNFGFIVDNATNKIVSPAPLFDHGNSLFNFAGRDDLQSADTLKRYSETLLPCVYDDFMKKARRVLASRHREGLRRLVDFRFKRHSRYNLPPERLKLIEKIVSDRAKELLQNG